MQLDPRRQQDVNQAHSLLYAHLVTRHPSVEGVRHLYGHEVWGYCSNSPAFPRPSGRTSLIRTLLLHQPFER